MFQGTCVALNTTINNFRCACPAGYTGHFCELFTDVCVTNPCDENTRCVLSQFTQTHFTCVATPYVVQIRRDVALNELLFGSNEQRNLQSSDTIYQLEKIIRHFIQNIEVHSNDHRILMYICSFICIRFLKILLTKLITEFSMIEYCVMFCWPIVKDLPFRFI